MEFRLLGPLEVVADGRPLPLGGKKQRGVLAALLVRANEVVSREQAIDSVWEDSPPEHAVNALQVHVHGLRRALGPDRIAAEGAGYLLRADPNEVDARRFELLFDEGRTALELGDARHAVQSLTSALALWRGQPLADLPSSSFVEATRVRFGEERLQTLELRIEAELALDRGAELIAELQELVVEHPFRERLRGHLMLALYRSGRQNEALDVYGAGRRTLADELGLEPSVGLRELQRAILRQDSSLRPPEPRSKVHLPQPKTRLVGRRFEIAAVCFQLRESPLLTLTGPGGVGKTRIAIEAAGEVASDFDDGVFFVDLAATREPSNVPAAIAATYGLVQTQGERTSDALFAELRRRNALLVLDNFEQLLEAAPFVTDLLAAAPRLRILITSRTRLRVADEQEYIVPPLDVPRESADIDAVALNDSVAVFVERARSVDAAFRLTEANAGDVSAVCRALEGLPLSLELAAARSKLVTPAQMRARLVQPLELLSGGNRDLPDRQRSLRATIDWSYELLDPRQQRLLAELSVFAGGCTLEQAEAVCGATLEPFAALLDNSLLQREHQPGRTPRFRMLETVRSYASERLAADDSDAVRRQHAEYFARLAELAAPELIGPRAEAARELLSDEHDNFSAALEFALHADLELGFRLVAGLSSYWETVARGREVRGWLEQALPAAEGPNTRARVGASVVFGRQLIQAGDYTAALPVLDRAALDADDLASPALAAHALAYSAWLHVNIDDRETAARHGSKAIALAQQGGDLWVERLAHAMVANTFLLDGDHARARVLLDRSLAIARLLADKSTLALAMINSGYGAFVARDLTLARSLLEEALVVATEINQPIRIVSVQVLVAQEANAAGDHDRARSILRDALDLVRNRGRVIDRLELLTQLAHALAGRDPSFAARLLGAADADYARRNIIRPSPTTARHQNLHASLAVTLGQRELAHQLDDGAVLTLDEAIDVAFEHEQAFAATVSEVA